MIRGEGAQMFVPSLPTESTRGNRGQDLVSALQGPGLGRRGPLPFPHPAPDFAGQWEAKEGFTVTL